MLPAANITINKYMLIHVTRLSWASFMVPSKIGYVVE